MVGNLSKLKSGETLDHVQIGKRVVKKTKKSQVSVGESSKLGGGVFGTQKSPKFQRVSKNKK